MGTPSSQSIPSPSNLVATAVAGGALPAPWEAVCPNRALAPLFSAGESRHGTPALVARGNGRRECFGYLRHPVQLEAGKTYNLRVRLRYDGLEDLHHHLVHMVFAPGYNDGIFSFRSEKDGTVTGEGRFAGPDKPMDAEVRLYFRFSPHGQVWWEHVSLEECEPIPPRLVKVACTWGYNDLAGWSRWLDRAGEKGVDVALMPEFFNDPNWPRTLSNPQGVMPTEPIDGPAGTLLSAKARQWHMYTTGSFLEKRGDLVLNSAPLYDREGQLVGIYSKSYLAEVEEDKGVTPGPGYPVFQTDFGSVGIVICYDIWHPETFRLLAYKGAELILFLNGGYYEGVMPARASDNGVWVAVSSCNSAAGVWDPGGWRAGEFHAFPPNWVASTIRVFEKDDHLRMMVTTVDLSRRLSPAWWGGPMRAAAGGRRNRRTLIEPIEEELAREARRWDDSLCK